MALIILQKETGSALVYLSFLMLYREGMTGTVLFSGICAVVFFIVGLKFSAEIMPDEMTSWENFSVLTLVILLSFLLVGKYCQRQSPKLPITFSVSEAEERY